MKTNNANIAKAQGAEASENNKRSELIKEISNTLWKYTKGGIHSNGVEINEELDGAEVKVTIEDWPDGAIMFFNDKRYRTHQRYTKKKDIVEMVTKWVDEVIDQQKQEEQEVDVDEISSNLSNLEIRKSYSGWPNGYLIRLEWDNKEYREQAFRVPNFGEDIFKEMGYVCHTKMRNDEKEEEGIYGIDCWCDWWGSLMQCHNLAEFLVEYAEGCREEGCPEDKLAILMDSIHELKYRVGEVVGCYHSEEVKGDFANVYSALYNIDSSQSIGEIYTSLVTVSEGLLPELAAAIYKEETSCTKLERDAIMMTFEARSKSTWEGQYL